MAEKLLLRIRERASAGGDTYDYVKSQQVSPGEMWCLQHISYENETGARGTFRRYVERGDYNEFLGEHQSPGSAELIVWDGELWLSPGDRLVIRQASCTSSDALALYARGYKTLTKDIP